MTYGLANATVSDQTNYVKNITISPLMPDNATGDKETFYQNTKWTEQYATFLESDDFQQALIMATIWTVGKGFTADPETTVILDHVTGWGKDSFLDVIFNQSLTSKLAGDSYAEIIRDEKSGTILNLKPVDPGTMKIIVDSKGIIVRYEQITTSGTQKFKPDEILHLTNLRVAGQIHGISVLESLKKIIVANKESFSDMQKIMHRQARPMIMFKVGTDNAAEIAAFKIKMDNATNLGENIFIPNDANTIDYNVVQINLNAMLLSWRDHLNNSFFRALGMPVSLFGGTAGTESSSKISYLAHETIFAKNALYLEQQIWNQLYLKVKFNSPATLLDNLQTDQAKDANQGMEIQQNDLQAGRGA
jgi:hypothetical protein